MTDTHPDIEIEPSNLDDSDDDFQYEEVEVARWSCVYCLLCLLLPVSVPHVHTCHEYTLPHSVGDDDLIGEDLDSALRSLQNLTAQVSCWSWDMHCIISSTQQEFGRMRDALYQAPPRPSILFCSQWNHQYVT